MSEEQASSRYKSIIKKAKESRSSKEKLLNSSHDASFTILRKKAKQNLSRSFVMRQTMALSSKNKQLVSALSQNKQLNSELEFNYRMLQDKYMTLLMKLNSREVSLNRCLEELNKTKQCLQVREEQYRQLYDPLQLLISSVPKPDDFTDANVNPRSSVECSSKSGRAFVPSQRRDARVSQASKQQSHWKPNLSMVQETYHDESRLEISHNTSDMQADDGDLSNNSKVQSEISSPLSPSSKSADVSHDSCINLSIAEDIAEVEDNFFDYSGGLNSSAAAIARKERRRTSIFSISSFDPDEADFNLECVEEELETSTDGNKENPTEYKISNSELKTDEALLQEATSLFTVEPTEKTNSVKKVAFKTRKKSFKNTPFGDTSFCNTLNSTNYSEQSMDLTAPVESEIVVKKPTKKTKYAIKKRDQKKKTKRNAEKKGKKTQKLDDTITEKDIYDNSADSFLLNPEKKIELVSKSKPPTMKVRSLPMTDISNEMSDDSSTSRRSRRRTAVCLSYKEPSISKKLRQGDKLFPVSFVP